MPEERPRLLIVEDDRNLLELTGAILGQHAQVDCTPDPAHALRQMASQTYQVLITDLNIVQPYDGLLLAGAMRHLQPGAKNILITGYPDFTHALAAMQASFDLTLLKPVELEDLRQAALQPQAPRDQLSLGRWSLWEMIEKQNDAILGNWLHVVENDDELKTVTLSPSERLDHIREILNNLAGHGAGPRDGERKGQKHGQVRREQQYRPEWIARELSYLRREILQAVLTNLLELDLSRLPPELLTMNTELDAALLASLREFGLLAI